jgi:hypothetical protein
MSCAKFSSEWVGLYISSLALGSYPMPWLFLAYFPSTPFKKNIRWSDLISTIIHKIVCKESRCHVQFYLPSRSSSLIWHLPELETTSLFLTNRNTTTWKVIWEQNFGMYSYKKIMNLLDMVEQEEIFISI